MIKKIIRNFRCRRNSYWIKKHWKELYDKYDGLYIKVLDCRVIAVGNTLSDLPYGTEWYENGSLDCYIPIKAEHLFGCTIEELIRRRDKKEQ